MNEQDRKDVEKRASDVLYQANEKVSDVLQVNEKFDIADLVKTAIEKGNFDIVERVMILRDKLKAEKSKEDFDKALRSFQEECPVIERLKEGNKTKTGSTAFVYAPLEYIVDKVRSILTKNGFSYMFKTEFLEKAVKTSCFVSHIGGHTEIMSVIMPLDTSSPLMSSQQIVGSCIAYGERYSFTGSFGIVTRGEDNEKMFEGRQKSENQVIFETLYKNFTDLSESLKEKLTDAQKKSVANIEMAKDVNKLSLKALKEFVDYLLTQYPATTSKIVMGVSDDK
jgi:hypothetical protein